MPITVLGGGNPKMIKTQSFPKKHLIYLWTKGEKLTDRAKGATAEIYIKC